MKENMETKEGVQVYELGYLLLPSIAEENLPAVVAKLKGAINAAGGVEIESEDPFRQDLAYSMTKVVGASRYVVKDAYIGWIKFEAEASQAPLVNDSVSKMDEVLRALLIKAPRNSEFTFAKAKALIAEKLAKAEAERRAQEDVSDEVVNSPAEETVVE